MSKISNRYLIAFLLLAILFGISYLKETFVINFFEGDWFLNRKYNGFRWGTVGYDMTKMDNSTRFYSGVFYIVCYLMVSVLLIWKVFNDKQLVMIFMMLYISTGLFSVISFICYRKFLWDGFFVASTRLKELITSPMYILVTLIIFYITVQKKQTT